MDPDFQRDFIWSEDKQSRLIESVITAKRMWRYAGQLTGSVAAFSVANRMMHPMSEVDSLAASRRRMSIGGLVSLVRLPRNSPASCMPLSA